MIKDDMTPFALRVTFKDSVITRTQYTDDRRYYERLVAMHGHLTDLHIAPVALTAEQQARLTEAQAEGLDSHDASVYVEFGTTESEGPLHDATKLQAYFQAKVAPAVKLQRKQAEAEGVAVNGIRYSGDESNRQALQEAILAADDAGLTEFAAWKCSDNQYHQNHPVADVKQALRAIGARRSALIALEALHVAQVAAGEIDIHDLDWGTQHD